MPGTRPGRAPHLRLVGEAPGAADGTPPAGADPNAPPAGTPPTDALDGAPDGGGPSGRGRGLASIDDSLDEALDLRPVPQDVLTWRALAPGSFELPWRDLPDTLHQEPGYLAVALVHYPALRAVDAVLHLRVPAGTPGIYLNPFDHGDRLPAPTLLLARGLLLLVREVRRQDGQWRVEGELLPHPPGRRRQLVAVPEPATPEAAPEPARDPRTGIAPEGDGHGR